MKKSSKLACLFSLWLLSGLFTVVSINVTVWAWVRMDWTQFTNLQEQTLHKARLRTLYLWNGENTENEAWMSATEKTLDIFKWLIVEKSLVDINSKWSLIVIGGWQNNTISNTSNEGVSNSGIAWWEGNTINVNNAAIGGWSSNSVSWENGVVAWWFRNNWNAGWVVLWWQTNTADGVVLWWESNTVWENGLAMWNWAVWGKWAFVRNDGTYQWDPAKDYSALIWTRDWVLIWTYETKPGVSLVVNWPIQVWNTTQTSGIGGEIRSIGGCLYAFDEEKWHVLGKSSVWSCNGAPGMNLAQTCEFGRVLLQEWDKVMAYSTNYSKTECSSKEVVCTHNNGSTNHTDWILVTTDAQKETIYVYPSCFVVDPDPYYLPEN